MVSFLKKITTRKVGSQFEKMAEEYLQNRGLKILTRNYLAKTGEIDLIMLDHNCLTFIEVRYRNASQYGSAIETISINKQRKIMRTAEFYLTNHTQYQSLPCRFDVVGIDKKANGEITVDWIQNAFME